MAHQPGLSGKDVPKIEGTAERSLGRLATLSAAADASSSLLTRLFLGCHVRIGFLVRIFWFLVPGEHLTCNHTHTCHERNCQADAKYHDVTHLTRFPRERMLGTHKPTNIACSFATSGFPRNHKPTLKRKLAKAAIMKYVSLFIRTLFVQGETAGRTQGVYPRKMQPITIPPYRFSAGCRHFAE
jgi:hypothetical protein